MPHLAANPFAAGRRPVERFFQSCCKRIATPGVLPAGIPGADKARRVRKRAGQMTSVPHPLRRDGLRLLLPGALLATALALGACGSTSSTAAGAPPRSTPPTTVPAATTTPPPTSAPATTTTPSAPSTPDATPAPGSPDRYPICTAPTIAYGGVTSFVGHFGAVITVKSNDTSPCVLAAYPDIAGLDASG